MRRVLPLLLWPGLGWADGLSSLDDGWQARLAPLPELDVVGAEAPAQQAIAQRRAALLAAMDAGVADHELAVAWGELAGLYQLQRVYSAAGIAYANAQTLAPDDWRWPYYRALWAQEQGRVDEALAQLAQARALKPDYPAMDLREGQLRMERSELDAAEPLLLRATETPGLRAAALAELGQLDLLRRQYPRARERLQQALALDPQASQLHYPLAMALRALGDSDAARAQLRQQGKTPVQVREPMLAARAALLDSVATHYDAGIAALHAGRFAEGAAQFAEGLKRDPDNFYARLSHARLLYLAGDREAASKALAAVPEHTLGLFLRAVLAHYAGDETAAIALYRRAIELAPTDPGPHQLLGALYYQRGDLDAAEAHFAQAYQVDGGNLEGLILATLANERLGRLNEERLAPLAHEVSVNGGPASYALARIRLFSSNPELRDPGQALALARQAMAARPGPMTAELLAQAQAINGDHEAARQGFEHLLSMLLFSGSEQAVARVSAWLQATEAGGDWPLTPVWLAGDPALSPAPLEPRRVFRNYPAARSY